MFTLAHCMTCQVLGYHTAAADTPLHVLAGAEAAAPQAADQAAPAEPETPADPAKPEAEAAEVTHCTLSCRVRDLLWVRVKGSHVSAAPVGVGTQQHRLERQTTLAVAGRQTACQADAVTLPAPTLQPSRAAATATTPSMHIMLLYADLQAQEAS